MKKDRFEIILLSLIIVYLFVSFILVPYLVKNSDVKVKDIIHNRVMFIPRPGPCKRGDTIDVKIDSVWCKVIIL